MKTNYLLKSNNRENKKTFRIIVIAIIIFVIIFLIHIIFPKLFSILFNTVGRLLWKTENVLVHEGYGTTGYFMSKRLLLQENNSLKMENEFLKNENLKLSVLEYENEEFKKILGRINENKKMIIASVLQRPPVTFYDNIIVDAGVNEDVENGDKVVVGGSDIIGEVEEVLGKTSKVKLYSTSEQKTDVLIGTSTIQAVAIGRGGGNFEVIIPRSIKILPGEFVFLPSINQQIFGIVEDTITDPTKAFNRVLFRSPYNISSIKWVEIIKP
ncbi:MAG: hypothetical protein NUV47_00490 [Patescibacteria group bacterium]|nr:hypothetical protein [Patescibacteria group bacterium]